MPPRASHCTTAARPEDLDARRARYETTTPLSDCTPEVTFSQLSQENPTGCCTIREDEMLCPTLGTDTLDESDNDREQQKERKKMDDNDD
jgi:hypothetical protein